MTLSVKEFLDFNNKLVEMKEIDYKNILVLTAILDLLFEKGIITEDEFQNKVLELETSSVYEIILNMKNNRGLSFISKD